MINSNLAGTTHIFDIDKTVINAITVKEFIKAGILEKIIPIGIIIYIPYLFLALQFKILGRSLLSKKFHLLSGISQEELMRLSYKIYKNEFKQLLNKSMVELINTINRTGGKVLIASASFSFILKPFSAEFAAQDVISTEIEFKDGFSTGKLKKIPAYGNGKLKRVSSYLETMGIEAEKCSFYSDSYSDLELFEYVGTPVAVNPDHFLRRIALRRGWKIIKTQPERSQ
ncbi:HAD family phosphatase [Oceanispirochaeta sp.]|jgi:HAD superfamily hydrolase (TIGR01490 family)|uniref:HAD family hydrolase n=1 Tax=Oceanispirochaeta sp. TaxID=2035350 RepID=UPI00261F0306|nr:HAD family phosphatase [Oceanispirochaeta sp.]MDA3958180.1 HAD family phosphatase [Oceanispirochaeta sp.]